MHAVTFWICKGKDNYDNEAKGCEKRDIICVRCWERVAAANKFSKFTDAFEII